VQVRRVNPLSQRASQTLRAHGTSLGIMSLAPGRYRFNGRALEASDSSGTMPMLVADSWLTLDGNTIALNEHFARFSHSAQRQGLVNAPGAFLDALATALPSQGTWFPRIELTVRGELMLWLREAPARFDQISLWSAPADPRTEPAIKGPDIAALEDLRTDARAHGADEAVLLTARGEIIDGATTCLLWWRDDQVFTPPADFSRVDSVTVRVLARLFGEQGVELQFAAATPAELENTEVWAVNALHGIRVASSWVDGPQLNTSNVHATSWRAVYEAQRQA